MRLSDKVSSSSHQGWSRILRVGGRSKFPYVCAVTCAVLKLEEANVREIVVLED
ncbi:hypothetical protein SFRURICE_015025 [Spodoptera frugiperda]|uniref:SFRICE_022095 n=1 Tax=Spodoptera frugiperda TaxID=7108 RepID=A0A2H1V595_SPOFR|nr:hypothetical protein SFRURICE_015025 [Spodoptera frugiperda]